MIEEMEIKMRNLLQEVGVPVLLSETLTSSNGLKVYFGKIRDIMFELRSIDDLDQARRQRELQKELVGFMKR